MESSTIKLFSGLSLGFRITMKTNELLKCLYHMRNWNEREKHECYCIQLPALCRSARTDHWPLLKPHDTVIIRAMTRLSRGTGPTPGERTDVISAIEQLQVTAQHCTAGQGPRLLLWLSPTWGAAFSAGPRVAHYQVYSPSNTMAKRAKKANGQGVLKATHDFPHLPLAKTVIP